MVLKNRSKDNGKVNQRLENFASRAYHESNYVVIEISDDGRGLDLEKIRQNAILKGFVEPEELDSMNEKEIMALTMQPGFSTASEVTHTSGRGVGMDVVKDHIEKLNGTVDIFSSPGAGARFKIKNSVDFGYHTGIDDWRRKRDILPMPLSTVDETIRNSEFGDFHNRGNRGLLSA